MYSLKHKWRSFKLHVHVCASLYLFSLPSSPPTKAGYVHASKLVSSLSDFQVTRKFWKDDILELFLEQTFFVMDKNSIQRYTI